MIMLFFFHSVISYYYDLSYFNFSYQHDKFCKNLNFKVSNIYYIIIIAYNLKNRKIKGLN